MDVTAEGPGLVREIHVAVGEAVAREQELLTIEAMKMFTPVLAPAAGQVTAIHVSIDEYIDLGTKLVTIA